MAAADEDHEFDFDHHSERLPEATKFQTAILAVLAEETRYGLAIKEELEDYYGEKVNHGRLYPNLDQLVQEDLVEKTERDKRTNDYAITDDGRERLRADVQWFAEHLLAESSGGGD
ncbi:PadR family transcriptional regulator [Halobacterium hubeiense]|uniref:PadR family transcriptional regulator n=1 Tax=Halobacterium hubeiense TaxID=1407499 RepID=UPI000B7DE7F2|nr:PadR family transcriptional regulator [Halobacterium hubeiense]